MKYEVGHSLRINITGYTKPGAVFFDENEDEVPIGTYYQIDPDNDGKPRFISEEALDAIVGLGADVYKVTEIPVGEDDEDDLVEIGEIIPGTTIRVGGIEMEILDIAYPSEKGESGILCLAKDVLFTKAFDKDNHNDWRGSSLRNYLNREYLEELEGKIGKDALLPFERDLISDDGMTDYCDGKCVDKVSLITHDEYKRYRKHISKKSDWWWTLTPYSCRSSYSYIVRYVNTDGSLNYGHAYNGHYGVAPAFLLLPSLRVEIVETGDDENV